MNYILSSKTGIVSARILANLLNIKVYQTINKINKGISPIIRWGNSQNNGNNDTEYNSIEVIKTVSNKLLFSEFCKGEGIPQLTLYRGIPEKYPVFVRTLLNSYGGRGIEIINSDEEYEKLQEHPFSYFVKFDFELRCHVLNGEIVKIFKKIPPDGMEEKEFPIRNQDNGYHFSLRNIDKYPKARDICHFLYEKLNIKFCGVDLGYDPTSKDYTIIEVNSCPGLNEETSKIYAEFLYRELHL